MNFEDIDLDKSIGSHAVKSFVCPQCRQKTLKRYINKLDFSYLAGDFGRCDRENNCGYHLMPWDELKKLKNIDFKTQKNVKPSKNTTKHSNVAKIEEKPLKIVSYENFVQPTCKVVEKTPLFSWFSAHFGVEYARMAFERYLVGANKSNGVVFWQIDKDLRVRSDNQIQYKGFNRDKNIHPKKHFKVGDGYAPCLFGEHLLYYTSNKNPLIFIVESEKTALLCSLYFPTMPTKKGERFAVWLACSGSNGLTVEKSKVLAGYDVILVPDFHFKNRMEWGCLPMRKLEGKPSLEGELQEGYISQKQKLLNIGVKSCYVWNVCPNREDGADIADYAIENIPWAPEAYPPIEELRSMFAEEKKEVIIQPIEVIDPLQKMISKNPCLQNLIDVLGLV
jgi:hypothetical protein